MLSSHVDGTSLPPHLPQAESLARTAQVRMAQQCPGRGLPEPMHRPLFREEAEVHAQPGGM